MTAYLSAMRSYAVFRGRTSRGEFWRAHIVLLPLMLLAVVWLGLPTDGQPRSIWPILLFGLIVLPHLVPWVALMSRRLHDIGHTGWWTTIGLIPVMLVLPLGIVLLLAVGCIDGAPGENRFGPNPMDRARVVPTASTAPLQTQLPTIADPIAEVERLAQLRSSGSLSEVEFEVMKAAVLSQPRSGA